MQVSLNKHEDIPETKENKVEVVRPGSNPTGARRPQRKSKKKVDVQVIEESTPVKPKIDPVIEFIILLLSPGTPFIKRKQLLTEYYLL